MLLLLGCTTRPQQQNRHNCFGLISAALNDIREDFWWTFYPCFYHHHHHHHDPHRWSASLIPLLCLACCVLCSTHTGRTLLSSSGFRQNNHQPASHLKSLWRLCAGLAGSLLYQWKTAQLTASFLFLSPKHDSPLAFIYLPVILLQKKLSSFSALNAPSKNALQPLSSPNPNQLLRNFQTCKPYHYTTHQTTTICSAQQPKLTKQILTRNWNFSIRTHIQSLEIFAFPAITN